MAGPIAAEGAPTDVRLAVGALAAWLSVLATLVLPPAAGVGFAAITLLLAVLALGRRRRWSAAVALLLGCAGAAALATSVRVAGVDHSPLTRLASRRLALAADDRHDRVCKPADQAASDTASPFFAARALGNRRLR